MGTPGVRPDLDRFGGWVVAGLALILLYFSAQSWDLPVHDGEFYFRTARSWPGDLLLDREWSPFYVICYALFHRVLPAGEPMLIYASHRFLILFLTALLGWLVARRFLPAPLALIVAISLLSNRALLDNFHVVHSFGLLYALAVIFLSTRRRRLQAPLFLSMLLLGYFVRPEFLVAFGVALPLLWAISRTRWGTELEWSGSANRMGALLLITAAGAIFLVTTPGDSNRSFVAFAQQTMWRDLGETTMATGWQYDQHVAKVYGSATTVQQAAANNPTAFAGHVALNLWLTAPQLLDSMRPRGGLWLLSLLALAIALAGLASNQMRVSRTVLWVATFPFLASSLASCLAIRPTALYLLPWIPAVLFGAAAISARLAGQSWDAGKLSKMAILVLAVSLVLGVAWPARSGRPILEFSRLIASDHTELAANVLAFFPRSYCLYLEAGGNRRCRPFGARALQEEPFFDVLKSNEINFVLVDIVLRKTAQELGRDAELEQFEGAPESYGFQLVLETSENRFSPSFEPGGLAPTCRGYVRLQDSLNR